MQIRYLWSQWCNQYQWRAKKGLTSKFEVRCPAEKKKLFWTRDRRSSYETRHLLKEKKEKARKRFLKVSPKFFFCFGRKKIGIVFSGVSVRSELFGRSLFLLFRNFFSSSVQTLKNEPVCDSLVLKVDGKILFNLGSGCSSAVVRGPAKILEVLDSNLARCRAFFLVLSIFISIFSFHWWIP